MCLHCMFFLSFGSTWSLTADLDKSNDGLDSMDYKIKGGDKGWLVEGRGGAVGKGRNRIEYGQNTVREILKELMEILYLKLLKKKV